MKIKLLFYLLFFFICSCSLSRKKESEMVENRAEEKKTTYFVSVPLTKFSSIQSPCINVEIEDKIFVMELDIGFRGDLAIAQNLIDQIASKMFIRTKPMYGVRGNQYLENQYQIQKINIGAMSFVKPILQEESAEFVKDSVFVENGGMSSPREAGRIGWELFYNVNLLVDIKNSKIAFCDGLDTLKKQGYALETFIRAPLLIDRGLVEFEAKTSDGILRCMLDTGATYNLLTSELSEGKSIEQAMWDPENMREYSSFQIDGHDFGSISFRRFPIKLPIHVEAILGMEFFRDYVVFLDFSGGYAYFAKGQQ